VAFAKILGKPMPLTVVNWQDSRPAREKLSRNKPKINPRKPEFLRLIPLEIRNFGGSTADWLKFLEKPGSTA
jgi:hypothetical protein